LLLHQKVKSFDMFITDGYGFEIIFQIQRRAGLLADHFRSILKFGNRDGF
jgi:hypothetical protein